MVLIKFYFITDNTLLNASWVAARGAAGRAHAPGGYSHILVIRCQVCATGEGMVFKPFGLVKGMVFKPFGLVKGMVFKPFGLVKGMVFKPFGLVKGMVFKPFGLVKGLVIIENWSSIGYGFQAIWSGIGSSNHRKLV